jgi:hypothetical protein
MMKTPGATEPSPIMSVPEARLSRRSRRWIAATAAAALVVLAFNASRILAAVDRIVHPPPAAIIIVAPEGSETI